MLYLVTSDPGGSDLGPILIQQHIYEFYRELLGSEAPRHLELVPPSRGRLTDVFRPLRMKPFYLPSLKWSWKQLLWI